MKIVNLLAAYIGRGSLYLRNYIISLTVSVNCPSSHAKKGSGKSSCSEFKTISFL